MLPVLTRWCCCAPMRSAIAHWRWRRRRCCRGRRAADRAPRRGQDSAVRAAALRPAAADAHLHAREPVQHRRRRQERAADRRARSRSSARKHPREVRQAGEACGVRNRRQGVQRNLKRDGGVRTPLTLDSASFAPSRAHSLAPCASSAVPWACSLKATRMAAAAAASAYRAPRAAVCCSTSWTTATSESATCWSRATSPTTT